MEYIDEIDELKDELRKATAKENNVLVRYTPPMDLEKMKLTLKTILEIIDYLKK